MGKGRVFFGIRARLKKGPAEKKSEVSLLDALKSTL